MPSLGAPKNHWVHFAQQPVSSCKKAEIWGDAYIAEVMSFYVQRPQFDLKKDNSLLSCTCYLIRNPNNPQTKEIWI